VEVSFHFFTFINCVCDLEEDIAVGFSQRIVNLDINFSTLAALRSKMWLKPRVDLAFFIRQLKQTAIDNIQP
jgi:hypothetical protein